MELRSKLDRPFLAVLVMVAGKGARWGSMRLCEFCLHNGTADAGKSALHSGKCPEVLAAPALCRHRKATQ